ncbi:universal stress protein [Planosporangium thailandense]|uniref:Universal stress protein n=1 Tax=Planosporangium thailandense TaxID=765197 RepID=A0ABX0Y7Q3_9ACTN|nr:universal stress protein [Planosporangium thailandense]NJC73314.1 universal stress protein [Planosporangium thailandense]
MTGQGYRPVVVGVNGSLSSYGAVDWAAHEARRRGTALRLVHVAEHPDESTRPVEPTERWSATADEIITAAVAYARACVPDLQVTAERLPGDPVGRLVDESNRATVVVLGGSGLVGLRGLLAGSVGTRAAVHAHCPLVVMRPHVAAVAGGADPHHGIGRIVVGVDDSRLSQAALAFAFEEAAMRGLGLTAVRAWRYPVPAGAGEIFFPMYQRVDLAGSERELLAAAIAPFQERFPEVAVCPVAVQAISPSAALIHESGGAELLVVGCHGRGALATLLLGSVSQAALHRACCPVAVVHQT